MDQDSFHPFVRKNAHDVTTPLATITGFADLLAEDKSLPEGTREIATTIVNEIRRLSDMLEAFFNELSIEAEAE